MHFDTLACSVSHSTPVGADSVAVERGCRGGPDPCACSAPAATGRLGRGHRCSPRATSTPIGVYSVKSVVLPNARTERSVYIAPLEGTAYGSRPHTWPMGGAAMTVL